jgi:hypothetical protein
MNTTQNPKRAADWSALKIGDYFSKTRHALHQSINKKHIILCAKFKIRLSIPFTRTPMSKKVATFSWGWYLSFFRFVSPGIFQTPILNFRRWVKFLPV